MTADVRPRFVVLGASNASHALGAIVARVRSAHDTAVEILAAHGHGRSYGGSSRVLFVRELPGIAECGLWSALDARQAPTTALVTDVGNDLAYGAPPERVAQWIERDVDRLLAARARVVLTRLPIDSLAGLGRARFALVKGLLFPGRDIGFAEVLAAARELDARLEALARQRGVALVLPAADWYGLDPIHVRRSMRATACEQILRPLFGVGQARPLAADEHKALRRARPATRRFFGREQRCEQPCVHFRDGTTMSWY